MYRIGFRQNKGIFLITLLSAIGVVIMGSYGVVTWPICILAENCGVPSGRTSIGENYYLIDRNYPSN